MTTAVAVHSMKALYEAIERYMDAWNDPVASDPDLDYDDMLYRAMSDVVPTDSMGRWPWEDHFGEPDPNE